MKAYTIAGWSGSGKTTLITRLIKHFKSKNLRVIALKNVPHKYNLEPEAADTFRYLEAGADEVCLSAANEMLTMRRITGKAEVFDILEKQYAGCDILLLEGLRREDIPLIEVFNSARHDTPKFPVTQLSAVVSDKPVTDAVPNFKPGDIGEIAEFMEVYDGKEGGFESKRERDTP